MSSPAERTRAVADASRGDELARAAVTAAGLTAFAAGAWSGVWPLMILGAFLVGVAFGTLLTNADRRYLEGFTDGLVSPLSIGPAPAAQHDPGDRAHLRGLPGGLVDEDDGAAAGTPDGDQRADRLRPTGAHGIAVLADNLGIELDRRSRAPLDLDGNPRSQAEGPRTAPFPVPPAVGTRQVRGIQAPRAATRRQARRGRRPEAGE